MFKDDWVIITILSKLGSIFSIDGSNLIITFSDFVCLNSGRCFILNIASACIAVMADKVDKIKTVVNESPKMVFEFNNILLSLKYLRSFYQDWK